jgi:hypothetical protein
MAVFYRVHWDDCPELSADNAWSALWGATRSADGTRTECRDCDGEGELAGGTCDACRGEGWEDCVPGYSACDTPEELIEYFDRPGMEPWHEQVVVFEGRQVGTGADGEPTAVPERVIETMTWEGFLARHKETP